MVIATILSGGGGHWDALGNTLSDARPIKYACALEPYWRANDARICVCGSVRFGSGRNKFVQLLIRSRNSSGRFV